MFDRPLHFDSAGLHTSLATEQKTSKTLTNSENIQLDGLVLLEIASRIHFINRISLERVNRRMVAIVRSTGSKKERVSLTIKNEHVCNETANAQPNQLSNQVSDPEQEKNTTTDDNNNVIPNRKRRQTIITNEQLSTAAGAIAARLRRAASLRMILRSFSKQSIQNSKSLTQTACGSVLRSMDSSHFQGIDANSKKAKTVLQYANAKVTLLVR